MFAVLLELFLDIMGVTWTTFGMLLITLWLRYETLKLMCHWIGGIDDIHKVIKHNFYEHILEEKGNKIRLHLYTICIDNLVFNGESCLCFFFVDTPFPALGKRVAF